MGYPSRVFDRSIVAYVISGHNDNKLVFDTFEQAIRKNPEAHPLFHNDRGFQYTSKAFQFKLSKQGMEQSMSRVGHCIDNCPVEGFWGIVKTEMYSLNKFSGGGELRSAIGQYVHFYNYERFQERFGVRTPMEVRIAALHAKNPEQFPIAENKRISEIQSEICGITKCRKSHADAKTPTWNLRQ